MLPIKTVLTRRTFIPKGESTKLPLFAFRHAHAKCSLAEFAQQSHYIGDRCFNKARRDRYNGITTKTGIDL